MHNEIVHYTRHNALENVTFEKKRRKRLSSMRQNIQRKICGNLSFCVYKGVNVLNLHIIDLAKNNTHICREKLRKKKKERKNERILINRIPHSKSE
jgi:hypothetical protein